MFARRIYEWVAVRDKSSFKMYGINRYISMLQTEYFIGSSDFNEYTKIMIDNNKIEIQTCQIR